MVPQVTYARAHSCFHDAMADFFTASVTAAAKLTQRRILGGAGRFADQGVRVSECGCRSIVHVCVLYYKTAIIYLTTLWLFGSS